jgi:hypothetical protein
MSLIALPMLTQMFANTWSSCNSTNIPNVQHCSKFIIVYVVHVVECQTYCYIGILIHRTFNKRRYCNSSYGIDQSINQIIIIKVASGDAGDCFHTGTEPSDLTKLRRDEYLKLVVHVI